MKSTVYLDVMLCLLSLLFNPQDGGSMLITGTGKLYQTAQHLITEDSASHTHTKFF
jgi:hypothetical protein